MKMNFELMSDGSVKLEILGQPAEVAKIQTFIMENLSGLLKGLNNTATKERVDE
tara:strand:+ start:566 stop:727 length:162 start_codon:yes stop_codon:yes gene_type:complete